MKKFLMRQSSSFTYLNVTQFLGALNDNIFRWLLAFFLIDIVGEHKRDMILAIAGAVFVLPFLLFSSGSGTLADRFSKRNIIVMTKLMEVVVMSLGLLAFMYHFVVGAYLVLFLMATQSAIFSPSKYGIVPELVHEDRLSKANGLLSSFTYGAIIIGSFLGGFITQVSGRNYVAGASICVLIAIVGYWFSLWIEHTPPAGSRRKMSPRILSDTLKTLRRAAREPTLLATMCGSAYFMFVGAYIQLNCVAYAQETLGLSQEAGSYLFFLTSIGIGIGSILVGKISGKWVELGIVPIGGIVMSLGCILLDHFSGSMVMIVLAVAFTGMWGGIYLIPQDTWIQVASPTRLRGQAIAATNFLAYIGVLLASGFFMFIGKGLGDWGLGYGPDRGFTIMGLLSLAITCAMGFYLRDYVIRFLGMLFSRLCFKLRVNGYAKISKAKPAIFVATYKSWSDSLMLLGSQRRRIHFFVESPKGASRIVKLLRRFFKVTPAGSLDPKNLNKHTIRRIRKELRRGQSVCIFLAENVHDQLDLDAMAEGYAEQVNQSSTPVIPVCIERNIPSEAPQGWYKRTLDAMRTHATLTFKLS